MDTTKSQIHSRKCISLVYLLKTSTRVMYWGDTVTGKGRLSAYPDKSCCHAREANINETQ